MKKIKFVMFVKKKLKYFINIGDHPCADTFLKSKKKSLNLNKFPLIVGYCNCNHLSAVVKVSPHQRYKQYDYSYTSNNSPVSVSHFYNIADKLVKKFKINKSNKVVEIGSNDGTFLKNIKKLSDANILGIDPSDNMCKIAKKNGVKSLNIFFNHKNSRLIKKNYGEFDLLYGANVFNHIENPYDFLKACKKIVKKSGIIVLEVPDLDSLFKSVGFDTIYHEHRQYFSINSIVKLFKIMDLNLIKIEKIDYMSGSLRLYAKNEKYKMKYILKNKISYKNFSVFKRRISLVKDKILDFVNQNISKGNVIVGLGAATKGNTLLNFCKLDSSKVKCILEKSPYKIGKFMPGTGIKIVDEKKFKNYDAAIILPWNISKHLHKKFLQKSNISYTSISKIVSKLK